MSTDNTVIHIYHGDDAKAFEVSVQSLLKQMGDPGLVELNYSRLEGQSASLDEIATAANSMPFLAERRLVVVNNPLARLNSKESEERFKNLLNQIPETTTLVLLIHDSVERGKWDKLKESHWLRTWANKNPERARFTTCALPELREMPGWIIKQAVAQGGKFLPAAAQALSAHVGSNTSLAALEVDKLLTYVNFERPVEPDDVELLIARGGQADVFEMVDALAAGNATVALRQLHRLLEKEDHFILFSMVVRQFRLLLQAREILDEGGADREAAALLKIHPFVAQKTCNQARRFTPARLEKIFHELLEIDEAIKTSQTTFELALDTFIARVSNS